MPALTQHDEKKSKYDEKLKTDTKKPPAHPPLKSKKPLLKWKAPEGQRRTIGSLLSELGYHKPTYPVDGGKTRLFCFFYLIEGMECSNCQPKKKNQPCGLLHVDGDTPQLCKATLASLDTAIKKPPLANFFEWTEQGRQFIA